MSGPARPLPAPAHELPGKPWTASAEEVADALGVAPGAGLDEAEVERRLAVSGPNDLPAEPPRSLARSVLAQLRETIILVLLGAAVLTAATGDAADCAVILLVVAVNTTVGVLQERRAVGAMAALRSATTAMAGVLRGGHRVRVPTVELVPGDVLTLAEGDVVGADARLVTAHALQVDEALLTGESRPVDREVEATAAPAADLAVGDRATMVHAGTLVAHGSGTAVVVATGSATQLGAIATLLHEHGAPPTPLQRRLAALGRRLSLVALAGCLVVVVLGLLRGESWELMAVAGVSLAVAAIPESLPAVVALALAAATRRMAARGAIVRSLPAVEALGSITVLAADKTGTLTTGHTTCVAGWTPDGDEWDVRHELPPGPGIRDGNGPRALLEAAALCNDAAAGAPGTEGALLAAATAAGVDVPALRKALPRTHVVPFDAASRSMRTRHALPGGGELEIVKGAPEVVAGAAAPAALVADWAARGYRVLAVAAGPAGAEELVGLLGMTDPIRREAVAAVTAARAAGIRTIMITGDHPATAHAIAVETGILTGDAAADDPGPGLRTVYARTDPGGKLGIVADWQQAGHIVAMTGDGVNDAPALRAADVGVAMGRRGTEVAKEAADIVLTDDSLATVVAAIAEGRRVFDNVRRFVRYGVSGGLAELLVMLAGPFVGMPLPLLPGQILWVNLVTHGLPGVAIGSEAAEPDVGRRAPRPPREGIISRRTACEILALGGLVGGSCLWLALWARAGSLPWQTMLFATLALAQLGIALTTRSDRTPIWRLSLRGNPFLHLAVAASLAGLVAAIYLPGLRDLLGTTPLTWAQLGLCAAVAAAPALAIEIAAVVRSRRSRSDRP